MTPGSMTTSAHSSDQGLIKLATFVSLTTSPVSWGRYRFMIPWMHFSRMSFSESLSRLRNAGRERMSRRLSRARMISLRTDASRSLAASTKAGTARGDLLFPRSTAASFRRVTFGFFKSYIRASTATWLTSCTFGRFPRRRGPGILGRKKSRGCRAEPGRRSRS